METGKHSIVDHPPYFDQLLISVLIMIHCKEAGMRAVLIFEHMDRYLENSLIPCLFGKVIVGSCVGPGTYPVMGSWTGLQYQA